MFFPVSYIAGFLDMFSLARLVVSARFFEMFFFLQKRAAKSSSCGCGRTRLLLMGRKGFDLHSVVGVKTIKEKSSLKLKQTTGDELCTSQKCF